MRRTRRLSRALLVMVALLSLSACVRMQADYVIKTTDDMSMRVDVSVKKNDFGIPIPGVSPSELCRAMAEYVPPGAMRSPYETNEAMGCKTEMKGALQTAVGDTIRLDGNIWTFHHKPLTLDGQLKASSLTDFAVRVTFPGKVLTHNGESVLEGPNTVVWKKPGDIMKPEGLVATGENPAPPVQALLTSTNWWLILGIVFAGVFLVTALVVGFLALRKKRAGNVVSPPVRPKGDRQTPPPGGWYEFGSGPGHQKTPVDPPRWS